MIAVNDSSIFLFNRYVLGQSVGWHCKYHNHHQLVKNVVVAGYGCGVARIVAIDKAESSFVTGPSPIRLS